MNKISNTLKIQGILSICLWIIGSIFLVHENNGKIIILITAIIIEARLRSQIIKEKKLKS